MTDPHAILWFDREHRIGIIPAREDESWVLKLGGMEWVLGASELRSMLRAMRRLRDYRAGQRSLRKAKP